MTDSHQAIYDAVRSRISNGDVGSAIERAITAANIGHYFHMAGEGIQAAAAQYESPSAIYRPSLYPDGTKWCALYGEDLATGVAGFGDTPAEAMADFDKNWAGQLTPEAHRLVGTIQEEDKREAELAQGQFGVGA